MSRLLRLAPLLLLAAPALAQQPVDYVRVPFNVSIWRGISLGDAIAGDTSRKVLHHFSLNLPSGQADWLEGVAIGAFATVYEESTYGMQVAGLANVTGEEAAAMQVAGLANVVGESLKGVQVAGFANVVGEGFGGLQSAGLANVVGEGFRGLQASGLANVAGEDTEGGQFAGLANIAGEAMRGVQVAGLANISGEDLIGLQSAPFNIVGGTMRGVQVGVVNVANESAGLQVGVVNVAGEQRGIPVGLYSRVGEVPMRLDVWADETAALHVGVRSGSATVSNYFGVSARLFSGSPFRWGVFAGIGVEHPIGARTSWGLDAFAHGLFAEDFSDVGGTLLRLRAILTREVGERLTVFGGPAFSLFLSDDYDGDDLAPFTVLDDTGDTFVRAWLGLEAGLRLLITDN